MLVSINKHAFLLLLTAFGATLHLYGQAWSLKQCLDTAQVHNKTLRISRNVIEISRQKKQEAEAGLLPKVNALLDYRYYLELPYQLMPASVFGGGEGTFREAQFGVPHNINANVQVAVPLYNPQLKNAIQSSKIGQEITGLQYKKTEEQVYFEVSNLYYNAQIILNQIHFIENNLLNSKRLLNNMQLLKEHKMAKGTDVDKVVLQVEQLATQKEQLQSQYIQLLNALKFTMGLPMDHKVEVEEEIGFHDAGEYTPRISVDVQISKTQNHLLTNELNLLRNTYKPSVSFYGTYGTTGLGYDKSPNEFLKFYPTGFAGIQLTVPLFNGTVTKKKINQKSLELQNNELHQAILIEQNEMEVINARNQKAIARKNIETTLSQIKLAQSIYEQSILQQKQGLATLTDVLLADNSLEEAQQKNLSAIVDYLKADLELKKSTGNLINE